MTTQEGKERFDKSCKECYAKYSEKTIQLELRKISDKIEQLEKEMEELLKLKCRND